MNDSRLTKSPKITSETPLSQFAAENPMRSKSVKNLEKRALLRLFWLENEPDHGG
jgi:hypothetical protein